MANLPPSGRFDHRVIEAAPGETVFQGVPAGIEWTRDIVYRQIGQRRLHLDIWRPEEAPTPLPAVLWICGGGWMNMHWRGAYRVSAWLAGHGFAVLSAEYRCSGEAVFPACIEDLATAVQFVRRSAGEFCIHPERIGAWGDSAGGHLAALLGVRAGDSELRAAPELQEVSPAVSAICCFYPPTDLAAMEEVDGVQQLLGAPAAELPEAYKAASPIFHVNRHSPPHLLVHGTADRIVPFDQSARYAEVLAAAGVEVSLLELPRVGHDGRTAYGNGQIKQLVVEFFRRHLGR